MDELIQDRLIAENAHLKKLLAILIMQNPKHKMCIPIDELTRSDYIYSLSTERDLGADELVLFANRALKQRFEVSGLWNKK